MPLVDHFLEAARRVSTTVGACKLARKLWGAHDEGALTDDEAMAVSREAEARRRALSTPPALQQGEGEKAARRPRGPSRSPDPEASRERRRIWASRAVAPPEIRRSYTEGRRAMIGVIASECERRGLCALPMDAIAAIAGVSVSLAKATLQQARLLGHLDVEEQRTPGEKSGPNIIRIRAPAWLQWLRERRRRLLDTLRGGGGVKNLNPTAKPENNNHQSPVKEMRAREEKQPPRLRIEPTNDGWCDRRIAQAILARLEAG